MAGKLPFDCGEHFTIDISGLTHDGEGVGRFQGIPVFVPGAIPGDRIQGAICQIKKSFARGELLAVLKPAQARRDPLCSRWAKCGGCDYQGMEYGEQLIWKTSLVKESLSRISRLIGITVQNTVGMDAPLHYRNKATFQVRYTEGRISLGFYEKGATRLTWPDSDLHDREAPPPECLLPEQGINKIISSLISLFNTGAIRTELLAPLRQVQIRMSSLTGEATVVLLTKPGHWPAGKVIALELIKHLPHVTGLFRGVITKQPGGGSVRKDRLLAGKPYLTDRIGDITYRISPSSFYQVNPGMTRVLYDRAIEYAHLTGRETVVDAYSGIGAIALYMARQARQVYGLEVNPAAVADARANAAMNRIDNAVFQTGSVEKLLPAMIGQGLQPDALIMDPPRRGSDPAVLEAAVAADIKRIIYLSCDPATLARDLRFITDRGYALAEVQPIDMFPWTAHVETVCLLARNSEAKTV